MTKTLTVKNIGSNPTQVNTVDGWKPLASGASITAEFNDGEAANISGNVNVFEVGKAKSGKGKAADPAPALDRAALNAEAEKLGLPLNPDQTDAELAADIAAFKA